MLIHKTVSALLAVLPKSKHRWRCLKFWNCSGGPNCTDLENQNYWSGYYWLIKLVSFTCFFAHFNRMTVHWTFMVPLVAKVGNRRDISHQTIWQQTNVMPSQLWKETHPSLFRPPGEHHSFWSITLTLLKLQLEK